MRTQVAIIGAGPAGLLLGRLLHLQGIDSVILERKDRPYVEQRVRAGVLEHGTAETLREAGVGERLDAEGLRHGGIELRFGGEAHRIDFEALTGRSVTVYGQQEVVKDLIAARLTEGDTLLFDVQDVALRNLDGVEPVVSFVHQGDPVEQTCDFVIGADGFHGPSRGYVADGTSYERTYPFSWLGVLAEAAPTTDELIYARHDRGFALYSMRSPSVTRLYLQVPSDENLDDWSDDRIWSELRTRLNTELIEGPLLAKGITPMRSFVSTPMRHGRLLLAGDAAHIVPPTGAKGMNLAVADVRLLSRALGGYYAGDPELLSRYSDDALERVWRSTHFSWWMTTMLHADPTADAFSNQIAQAQLKYVASSEAMATSLAENYTGLPYTSSWSFK